MNQDLTPPDNQRLTSAAEYLHDRFDDQVTWMEGKSASAKKMFHHWQYGQIFISAMIPVLSIVATMMGTATIWGQLASLGTGILGAGVGIITGRLALYKYQEEWLRYRGTIEALKREKIYFQAGAGPYRDKSEAEAFLLLVENTEAILAGENGRWAKTWEEGS